MGGNLWRIRSIENGTQTISWQQEQQQHKQKKRMHIHYMYDRGDRQDSMMIARGCNRLSW